MNRIIKAQYSIKKNIKLNAFLIGFLGITSISSAAINLPIPNLPPETEVMYLPDSAPPNAESKDYIHVKTETTVDPIDFNEQSQKVRTVTIVGKTLVLEAGNINNLYDVYNNNSDIKEIILIAETLIINSSLKLPSTNVTIYTRSLQAGPAGEIITTPAPRLDQGNGGDNAGLPGLNGYKAGDLTVYAQESSDISFSLKGGDGGNGGLGRAGDAGFNKVAYNPGSVGYTENTNSGHPNNDGLSTAIINGTTYVVNRDDHCWQENLIFGSVKRCGGYDMYALGDPQWPGNGSDAKAPGKAGSGGASGRLQSNLDSSQWLNIITSPGANANNRPVQPGGIGGSPRHAYQLFNETSNGWTVTGEHFSVDGSSAAAPLPDPQGPSGSIEQSGHKYSWMHPLLLQGNYDYVKDVFLHSRNTVAVKAIIEPYINQLAEYQAMPEWAALPEMDKSLLTQIQSDMATMLYQIDSNLDYFGNPPGWVPLLSFEALQTLFTHEVDNAINVLYLQYWLSRQGQVLIDKKNLIGGLRIKLLQTITDSQLEYQKVTALLDNELKNKAATLEAQIPFLLDELKAMETVFTLMAENKSKSIEASKNDIGKVRMLAAALKVVPIPIVQGVSMALDVMATMADQPNPADAWGQINQLKGITDAYNQGYNSPDNATKRTQWNQTISTATQAANGIDFNNPASVQQSIGQMQQAIGTASSLLKPIADLKALSQPYKVSSEQVQAIAAQFKAENPLYAERISKVQALIQEKQKLADQINQAVMLSNTLQNTITKSVLAVDQFNQELASTNQVLDLETLKYVDSIARDAKERLFRYHYYMAKAFQYRMVETYPNNLNLQALFDKMKAIVDLGGKESLSIVDFEALKSLYTNQLRVIADNILTKLDTSEGQSSTTFALSAEQLNRINAGETIAINLMKPSRVSTDGFFSFHENIRILNMSFDVVADVGNAFSLKVEHTGISNIEDNGKTYAFNHYNQETKSPISWSIDYRNGVAIPVVPSVANDSLLRTLIGGADSAKMLLFSLPGGWADFNVKANREAGSIVHLTKAVLNITYTRQEKSNSNASLDIYALDDKDSEIKPLFTLNNIDTNTRKDGIDFFSRYYPINTAIKLAAPQSVGNKVFVNWVNKSGLVLSTNPIFSSTLTSDAKTIIAMYKTDQNYDSDHDGMPDWWEKKYGFDPLNYLDGAMDSDGDGLTNYTEYLQKSDPALNQNAIIQSILSGSDHTKTSQLIKNSKKNRDSILQMIIDVIK